MRHIEVRRHAQRSLPDGIHLIQTGVSLARRVGADMGPFARVVTSTLPRAFETAIAMGFAVDSQHEGLTEMAKMPAQESVPIDWDNPFAVARHYMEHDKKARQFVIGLADLWRSFLTDLPDGSAALAISLGGIIEGGAIYSFPEADVRAGGRGLPHGEDGRV